MMDLTLPQHKDNADDHHVLCHFCRQCHQKYKKPLLQRPGALSNLSMVADGLYLSNMCTAVAVTNGQEDSYRHITHVLSIYSGHSRDRGLLTSSFATKRLNHKQIILGDCSDTNLIEHFPEICYFIHSSLACQKTPDRRPINVLVHCRAGISRSATAIIAYLVWCRSWSVSTALSLLQAARPAINPNLGFIQQLELWAKLGCDLCDLGIAKPEYGRACLLNRWRRQKRTSAPDMDFLTWHFHRPPADHWSRMAAAMQKHQDKRLEPRAWCAIYWRTPLRQKTSIDVILATHATKERTLAHADAKMLDAVKTEQDLNMKLTKYIAR